MELTRIHWNRFGLTGRAKAVLYLLAAALFGVVVGRGMAERRRR